MESQLYDESEYEIIDNGYGRITTTLSRPIPAETHKKDGLTQGEWYSLFTPQEQTAHFKLKAFINDFSADLSFLPGSDIIDMPADGAIAGPNLGRPDCTFRDLMRDVYELFDKATYPPGISCSSPRVLFAMQVQIALGLITVGRSAIILQGLPL